MPHGEGAPPVVLAVREAQPAAAEALSLDIIMLSRGP
jgi:hypothetical protein